MHAAETLDERAPSSSPALGRLDVIEDDDAHDHCTLDVARARRSERVSRGSLTLGPELSAPPYETSRSTALSSLVPPLLTRSERLLLARKSSSPSVRRPLGRHA